MHDRKNPDTVGPYRVENAIRKSTKYATPDTPTNFHTTIWILGNGLNKSLNLIEKDEAESGTLAL